MKKKVIVLDNDNAEMSYIKFFLDILKVDYKIIKYNRCPIKMPRNINNLIITGSRQKNSLLLKYEKMIILDAINRNCKILGLCAGHQMLGMIFGSKLKRKKAVIKKINKIQVLKTNGIFNGFLESVSMVSRHQQYIDLPDNFELLATSNDTKNEAMKHKNLDIYSTQFHPSVSGYFGFRLLKNFFKLPNDQKK